MTQCIFEVWIIHFPITQEVIDSTSSLFFGYAEF